MKIYKEFDTKLKVGGILYHVTVRHRDWNPPPTGDFVAPIGTVWEVIAKVPFTSTGTLATGGGNCDEAMTRLEELIEYYSEKNND